MKHCRCRISRIFQLHREHPWVYRIGCLYRLGSPGNTAPTACINSMAIISKRFFSFNVVSTTSKRLMNTDSVRLFKWVERHTEQSWLFVSINVVYVHFWHVPFTGVPIYLHYIIRKSFWNEWHTIESHSCGQIIDITHTVNMITIEFVRILGWLLCPEASWLSFSYCCKCTNYIASL